MGSRWRKSLAVGFSLAGITACSLLVDTSGLEGTETPPSPVEDVVTDTSPIVVDSGDGGDAYLGDRIVDLDGEQIHLSSGWQVRVLRTFSADYTFRADDFLDVPPAEVESNAPRAVVPLVAPFEDGLAVLVGRQVLELRSNGNAILHDYRPSAPDQGSVPDVPKDLYFARPTPSTPGALLLSAGSYGGGDGIFTVDPSWKMSVVAPTNNCGTVAFDPEGSFGGLGTPQRYFSAYQASGFVRLSDSKMIVSNAAAGISGIADAELEPSGRFALVVETTAGDLEIGEVQATGATYPLRLVASTASQQLRLVTGDLTRLSNGIHMLANASRLVELRTDDTQNILVESKTTGYVWSAAAVLPKEHSLGASPVYVVVDSNRSLNLDRILLFTPPP